MKTHITILLLLSFLTACSGDDSSSVAAPTPERVILSGAGDLGIFDPSVSRDPDTNRLWMSYSSVDTSMYYVLSLYWTAVSY